MPQDRYLKLVLTVIAFALSVSAMARLGTPRAVRAGEIVEELSAVAPETPSTATSTLPLRWRVPYAVHFDVDFVGRSDCLTAVSVVGFGPNPIAIEVEFFAQDGTSEGVSSVVLTTPGGQQTHLTDDDILSTTPFALVTGNAGTGPFVGYALVFADDPRISVGAYMVCIEDGTAGHFPRFVTNLSAYPVGQTLSVFQAGIPGTGTMPPLAEPES